MTYEVTNVGIDKDQLASMAEQAREDLKLKTIEVLADKGYFNSDKIAACEQAGITVHVTKPITSNSKSEGRFDKRDFRYEPEHDRYVCPPGQHPNYHMSREEDGRVMMTYWTNTCSTCRLYDRQGVPRPPMGA